MPRRSTSVSACAGSAVDDAARARRARHSVAAQPRPVDYRAVDRTLVFAFTIGFSGACAAPTVDRTIDAPPTAAATASRLPERLRESRAAIAEAFALVDTFGERMFPGWPDAPKDIMLIDEEVAWLFCAAAAPQGWVPVERDAITGCEVWRAPAPFPADSKKTLETFNNRPTVVIGTTEALGLSGGRFALALVRERLHQLQMSTPDFRSATLALGLHGGDETGKWMQGYDFPFNDRETRKQVAGRSIMLASAVQALSWPTRSFEDTTSTYLTVRQSTMDYLSAADARYMELCVWQEGVARYVEVAMAEKAIQRNTYNYAAIAKTMKAELVKELRWPSILSRGRAIFSAIGAGEALVLDRHRPKWRGGYLTERFTLSKWFSEQR